MKPKSLLPQMSSLHPPTVDSNYGSHKCIWSIANGISDVCWVEVETIDSDGTVLPDAVWLRNFIIFKLKAWAPCTARAVGGGPSPTLRAATEGKIKIP
ncbi:hypothetical protein EVAR_47644_1 [Eumeta japonica]|uniref:Uncharacterized protein n=1 Tax=Eumeta variegata TaxID=151549 RepID=A0A4C1ZBK9_EUMVA|nr:hypothetical protein EVAR_47644_1 [Eumeta japonica]